MKNFKEKLKKFLCSHEERDIMFYRGKYWDIKDSTAHILGGNALKWERCKKCGREWETEGWVLPQKLAAKLKEKPSNINININ